MAKAKTTKATSAASASATPAVTPSATTVVSAKVSIPVDEHFPLSGGTVVDDYDAMLNQTNIGANNNKFYVIQVVADSKGKIWCWNRWGRVGEVGQSGLKGVGTLDSAVANFESKFKDKTGNAWSNRKSFVARAGKYTLIEIDRSADAAKKAEEVEAKLKGIDKEAAKLQKPKKGIAKSALHGSVENLMTLIFNHDVFRGAMASFDIDVKKMPLGQLSKSQVSKGYDVLTELEDALKSNSRNQINTLSSKFYTLIPHSFGRKVPPPIDTEELLSKKKDMLNVLNDIEIALSLQNAQSTAPAPVEEPELDPNPADINYGKLKCDLEYVDPKSEEYALIERYLKNTGAQYYNLKLIDAFRMNRHGEADRFKTHSDLAERKLLWHGTNVAVVAAILGTGLRIMPHSGGRVGKGIYLASENGKSVNYVGWAGTTGCMFLAEAALGKEHTITRDDSSLKAAPKGFQCIVARGHTEPDPKDDVTIELDGNKVVVPVGKPIAQPKYAKSTFTQSEYLVYSESQVRLRYVLRVQR